MLKGLVVILLLFIDAGMLLAQPKITQAIKVTQGPRIDGSLDDSAWQYAR
jgi:hypothetical protein